MADTPQMFRLNVEVGDLPAAAKLYEALFAAPGRLQAGHRAYFACGPVTLQVVQSPSPHPVPKALYFTVADLDAVHARAASLNVLSKMMVHGALGGRSDRAALGRALLLRRRSMGQPVLLRPSGHDLRRLACTARTCHHLDQGREDAMLMWALLVALGTMLVFPDTQIARVLRLWLVEKPAAWLAGLTAAKLLKWLLVAPIVMALVLTSPELLPLLATLGDAGLVLELLLALWMAAVVSDARAIRNRIAGLVAAVARLGRLVAPRPRAPRAKRRPRPAKPADSGDEPGFGLAFA